MSHILVMSSWTSVGHVGLSAAVPVLQALGHTVTQLPTVILSNHPGWPRTAGGPVAPKQLASMIDALDANGWLADHDAVLTGYFPTPEHVAVACDLIARLRRLRSRTKIVVDPILGDDPKGLYIEAATAEALCDRLVPVADVLTPNRFELGWLTGLPVETLEECRASAIAFADAPRERAVFVTSPPVSLGSTGVLAITPDGNRLFQVPLLADVPHGTGDVFSALVASGVDVGGALGHLQALIEASVGSAHLEIVGAVDRWRDAAPVSAMPQPIQPGA